MMKQKMVMFVVSVLAVFSFAAASAQTTGNQPNGSSTKGAEQVSGQQYLQQKQAAAQKPNPAAAASRPQSATGITAIGAADKNLQALSINELMLLKKQAETKGLPTTEYDIAIQQRLANRAK